MILAKLFLVFLRVGLFAIGGAYSFLPLIEKEVVEKYHWLSKEEFLDVLGISQVFPGAISIKYATYTGYKIAGILGIIAANLGNLVAPVLLIFLVGLFYIKYKDAPSLRSVFNTIQMVVFALVISLAFQLVNVSRLIQPANLFIVLISFILFFYAKIHPAWIIVCAAIIGIFTKK